MPPADWSGKGAGIDACYQGGLTRTYYENRDDPEWSRGFDAGFWRTHWRLHGEGGDGGGGGGN